jgi:stringent starvation protein B
MTSTRPYLIRALYEWIEDNGMTPHILVDADRRASKCRNSMSSDGRIVLNINSAAVRDLRLGNDWIEFNARFGGVARTRQIPVAAVLAIYARENGQGMAFGEEKPVMMMPPTGAPPADATDPPVRPGANRRLKIVK